MAHTYNVNSRTIVSPLFLFGTTLLTLSLIAVVLYQFSRLAYHEEPMVLQPVHGQDTLQPVKVGLTIESFDTFDINHEKFEFNAIVSFEFDEKAVSLEQLQAVQFARARELYRSEPAIFTEQGRTRVYYHVKVRLFENLDFSWFPFEDHQISIMLVDRKLQNNILTLVSDDNSFRAPDMGVYGWHKFAQNGRSGLFEDQVQGRTLSYPAVVFTIDYGRHTNVRNIFMILLPMLLLFFIALFSLIIDPIKDFTFVLTIPVSSIAGLISFRFVMETMSPAVGYFMYSDYFFLLFLCLVFGILIFHTFGYHVGAFARKIMIVVFDLLVVIFCIAMVYHIDTAFKAMHS